MIDCGANAECTPEYLVQFAFMGSCYVTNLLNKPEPRVGLLNIGSEPSKGTELQKETYRLLMEQKEKEMINFIGNIEARDVLSELQMLWYATAFRVIYFLRRLKVQRLL